MQLQLFNLDIPTSNRFRMLIFIIRQVYLCFLRALFPVSVPLILSVTWLFNTVFLMKPEFSEIILILFFLWTAVPLWIALEEYYHSAALIQLGYSKSITLQALYIRNTAGMKLFPLRVSVVFQKPFFYGHTLSVLLAGPLCTFLSALILWFLIRIFIPGSVPETLLYCLMGISFSSFVPIQKGSHTDGYQIIHLLRENHGSVRELSKYTAGALMVVMQYLTGRTAQPDHSRDDLSEIKNCAWAYFQDHRIEDAAGVLEKAVSKYPEDPELCNNLAFCYVQLGIHSERAGVLAARAVCLAPDNSNNRHTYKITKRIPDQHP